MPKETKPFVMQEEPEVSEEKAPEEEVPEE